MNNGDVAVIAFGKYMKMPIGKIADSDRLKWQVTVSDDDPKEIDI